MSSRHLVLPAELLCTACGAAHPQPTPRLTATPTVPRAVTKATTPAKPTARVRLLTPADERSFTALAAKRGGRQGLALSTLGRRQDVQSVGRLEVGVAWSTSKVPIAMAVIAAGRAQAHAQDLRQAIEASDNAAATRLWDSLGGGRAAAGRADEQLRSAGDHRTR